MLGYVHVHLLIYSDQKKKPLTHHDPGRVGLNPTDMMIFFFLGLVHDRSLREALVPLAVRLPFLSLSLKIKSKQVSQMVS